MLEFAATLEHPAQSVIPLVRGLRSTNQTQLRASSILDTVIRMCNVASDAPSAISWIRLLAELETKHSLPAASPDTLVKPFRTFAVHRLNVKQRCALLRSHYELAAKALPQRTFAALWAGSRIPLGSLRGRTGNTYHLMLGPSEHCAREGESSLILIAEDGFELARLTFTLVTGLDGDDGTQVLIGGLQGPTSFFGGRSKERVVAATRDLSGFRPKMAVFIAASTLGHCAGASTLLGVANHTHSINSDAWYQRRRMVADYNAFWVERGGVPVEWGFRMPLNLEPRSNCASRNNQRRLVAKLVGSLFGRDFA
jgi:uncharacterized protein VirK/YbjX